MNLKDLAETLGLSQSTVSRALNGYPEVSETTRIRVREAALKHGYHPDTRARSLATGKAMVIGLVIPNGAHHETVNPIFADFVAGAGEKLSEAGYEMMLSLASDEEGAYRVLAARGRADGLIVQAPLKSDWRISMLLKLGLPFVVHGRVSDDDASYSWLDMDNRRAFHRATDHLLDFGHRRIALLNGIADMDFAMRRRDGFETALAARSLAADPDLIRSEAMTETYGYRAARDMLARPDPPTAFLTSSLLVAMGARRAIQARGLRMGTDVSVVTHDDDLSYLPNGSDTPIFTATRSSVHEAGLRTAAMLLDLIADPTCGPLHCQLEAELIIGPSSGPCPDPFLS